MSNHPVDGSVLSDHTEVGRSKSPFAKGDLGGFSSPGKANPPRPPFFKGGEGQLLQPNWIFPAILFILLLFTSCTEKEQAKPKPDVPVKTVVAIQKDVPLEVSAIGTVEAYSTVNITSRVDGQITAVHVREGETVEKGELLFEIDDRPYRSALASARASLSRNRVQLEKARKDAKRYAGLLKKDYVTKDQAEQAETNAEALEEMIKGDEAAVQNAELNLAYSRITAPITGRAGSILVHEGNLARANENTRPLMVINQIQPVYVRFSVPEQNLPEIQGRSGPQELTVRVSPPGNPDENRTGRLTFIDNTIDPGTGAIGLKAEFENADNRLWPGQFVNVVLLLGVDAQAVVVPSAAVQVGQQGQFLFVVKNDRTVELRAVTPGQTFDGWTMIRDGLAAGETVVTDGHVRLSPGTKIAVKNSASPADPAPGATK